ncbi:2,3-epoxybenzoyl-CoA dihydrolase [Alphaproteobacteria bacterium]|nr:2,3-epoxybenzoyl-CoA dihydrolase [Alphaproteobacteria bacterium]
MSDMIDFETDPSQYRHWRVEYDGDVAKLFMDVDENGGLFEGYDLKLNSYDLGVDIELADIVQRMRFEHPEIRVVVLKSGKDKVFCAGANIRMLAGAAHAHKVNFCKFTNETRNAIENAEFESGQKYVAAIKGACAGGGFELALACNHIMLVDDGASTVALPEVPLLAVLPGTGGLTRLTDKRQVRRDLCDVFCAMEEGVRGARALDWRLVDEIVSNSKFNDVVDERAAKFASELAKPSHVGIALTPLQKTIAEEGSVHYSTLTVEVDRLGGTATLMINGPDTAPPANIDDFVKAGSDSYMLRLARELDDAILHLRLNEREAGLLIFRSQGNPATLLEHEEQLHKNSGHWLANEVLLYWKRILKRVDVTSRSMIALVEHGSCFAGLLAELLFSVDRTYMMEGEFEDNNRHIASITLSSSNLGTMPMANGLSRLATRFLGEPETLTAVETSVGTPLDANAASNHGLVTFTYDDVDWEDEVRIFIEERASFSPDAMTGMEANLRFAGPETMETRIFGRLTAWQNWIFQRPNAAGEQGALQRYGTGVRGKYNMERV